LIQNDFAFIAFIQRLDFFIATNQGQDLSVIDSSGFVAAKERLNSSGNLSVDGLCSGFAFGFFASAGLLKLLQGVIERRVELIFVDDGTTFFEAYSNQVTRGAERVIQRASSTYEGVFPAPALLKISSSFCSPTVNVDPKRSSSTSPSSG
jgi:hypothetical protein